MLPWYRSRNTSLAVITIFIIIFTFGCAESRVTECNKLYKTANRTKNITRPKNAKEFERVAEDIATIAEEMQVLKLEDSKLKDFRSRLASVYSESSQAAKDISKAYSDKKQPEIAQINKVTKAIRNRESKLIDEINQYCKSP
jgi:regulator of replication initiation timing